MGTGRMPRLRRVAVVVALVTVGLVAGSVWGRHDTASPRRGEIVIKPTGRRVRVVTVRPADARRIVPVLASGRIAATNATTATAPAARGPSDGTPEHTERGVRLPLGYAPGENWTGPGPAIYCPAPPPPTECTGGGYGHTPLLGFRQTHDLGFRQAHSLGFGQTHGLGFGHGDGHGHAGWGASACGR